MAGAAGHPSSPARRARDAELIALQHHVERLEADLRQLRFQGGVLLALLIAHGVQGASELLPI